MMEKVKVKSKNVIKNVKNYFTFCFFILIFAFCNLNYHSAFASTVYSTTANQDVYEGQSFVTEWYLDTENVPVNVVDLKLKFSVDTLEVSDISIGNSQLNLWTEAPNYNNQTGTVSFIGGVSNGANSDRLGLVRITFHAKKSGQAYISFDPTSQALLNDGKGSGLTIKFKNESFNIYPKDFIPLAITSPTNPDQNSWYTSHEVVIKFTPKPGTEYSYSFSSNPEIIPDDTTDNIPAEISYHNQPDGIYYFKVNSKIGPSDWQEAGVYRIQIDSTPPQAFTPTIGSDPTVYNGSKFVNFVTLDKTSGIWHYSVKFGLFGAPKTVDSQYIKIPKFLIGNTIKVSAIDKAGNEQVVSISYHGIPVWIVYGTLIVLLVLITWFWARKIKRKIV